VALKINKKSKKNTRVQERINEKTKANKNAKMRKKE
jgi:hypothetical protein